MQILKFFWLNANVLNHLITMPWMFNKFDVKKKCIQHSKAEEFESELNAFQMCFKQFSVEILLFSIQESWIYLNPNASRKMSDSNLKCEWMFKKFIPSQKKNGRKKANENNRLTIEFWNSFIIIITFIVQTFAVAHTYHYVCTHICHQFTKLKLRIQSENWIYTQQTATNDNAPRWKIAACMQTKQHLKCTSSSECSMLLVFCVFCFGFVNEENQWVGVR